MIKIGNTTLVNQKDEVHGKYVILENETFYKISYVDLMPPFLMSVVSPADHWMFIASNGGLTAGRRNADMALFPYYTDDKLIDASAYTGSRTLLQIQQENKKLIWEPWSPYYAGIYKISRHLYKNVYGNRLIFEEVNPDLELTFRYQWTCSEKYGWVKQSSLLNHKESGREIEILDGLQQILPHGIAAAMQNGRSNLANAYKKHELDADTGLGIFSLSAMIVDRAEPSEALKATTVFALGLEKPRYLLSSTQLDAFRRGESLRQEEDIRGGKGAYFVNSVFTLTGSEEKKWRFVAEVNQGPAQVADLKKLLETPDRLSKAVIDDTHTTTLKLAKTVARADGLQSSADQLANGRHFANVLFNIMRGGLPDQHYQLSRKHLIAYCEWHHRGISQDEAAFFDALPDQISYPELQQKASGQSNDILKRLCGEYLPFTFSRRHGDPSRPWNIFSIETQNEDGSKALTYQGNWRDIFQNWEALTASYPAFLPGIVSKFLNATTADGYNPYRITDKGIDWEVIEPDDPWSFIGYWGDHQLNYLIKLLEKLEAHDPDWLLEHLESRAFVFANVPYRIKAYRELLANPKDTVVFDIALDKEISQRVTKYGADGKLVLEQEDEPKVVSLFEKILNPLLAKLSNFIPEAGIWMNTQRPEWNDANNALVGNGVSMVTLCYMRRYVHFLNTLFKNYNSDKATVTRELSEFLSEMREVLKENKSGLKTSFSDAERKAITDGLGLAGERYRQQVYEGFSGANQTVSIADVSEFLALIENYLDHTIRRNQREDKLFHAYNLVNTNSTKLPVRHLYEMLEGQVAALSSGILDPKEALELLDALKNSQLFREDQYSYLLYPDRDLPRFLEKNRITSDFVHKNALIKRLLADGNRQLVEKDANGDIHFSGDIHNAGDVKKALTKLSENGYASEVAEESAWIQEAFEGIFHHEEFTGRSGTFFGYEGLGSIYWHMVSKLLVAVWENYFEALQKGASADILSGMVGHYYEIRAGIGLNKNPVLYGAFPTDPYSHTPAGAGVKQPGMTGQVKEDILSRWAELGVFIRNSQIHFQPSLLRREELLKNPQTFVYYDVQDQERKIEISSQSLAFTYCQLPVIYQLGEEERIQVIYKDGNHEIIQGNRLPAYISLGIFDRSDKISQLVVTIKHILD